MARGIARSAELTLAVGPARSAQISPWNEWWEAASARVCPSLSRAGYSLFLVADQRLQHLPAQVPGVTVTVYDEDGCQREFDVYRAVTAVVVESKVTPIKHKLAALGGSAYVNIHLA